MKILKRGRSFSHKFGRTQLKFLDCFFAVPRPHRQRDVGAPVGSPSSVRDGPSERTLTGEYTALRRDIPASPKIMLLVLLSHVSVTIYMHLRLNALLPVRGPLAAHTNHHRHHAACRFAASHARPRAPRAATGARALRRVAWGLGRRVYTHKKSHTYQRFAAHQFTPTTHHLPSNCCCIRAHLASPSSTVALLIRKVTVGTSVCCCVKGPAVLGGSSAGVRLSSLLAPALG